MALLLFCAVILSTCLSVRRSCTVHLFATEQWRFNYSRCFSLYCLHSVCLNNVICIIVVLGSDLFPLKHLLSWSKKLLGLGVSATQCNWIQLQDLIFVVCRWAVLANTNSLSHFKSTRKKLFEKDHTPLGLLETTGASRLIQQVTSKSLSNLPNFGLVLPRQEIDL